MAEKKCVDCVFCGVEHFNALKRNELDSKAFEDVEEARVSAVCRFSPPSGNIRIKPMWPVVDSENDWCGMGKTADGKSFV